MTTVDNLHIETSIKYAENLKQFDEKIIREAVIASKVHSAVLDPTYLSNLSILINFFPGYSSVSTSEPPLGYSVQDFSFLALFTRPELNIRIQTQVDLDKNQPKISDENKTMESQEAAILTECIQKLSGLSRCWETIENNRLYLQKG